MTKLIRIATRSSPLAMWQARYVAQLLKEQHPHLKIQLVPIESHGDKDLSTPLYGMQNIGVFAKDVHQAVLDNQADIAVHSFKDIPTTRPEELSSVHCLSRHDPRDALIGIRSIHELPQDACLGTSSLRRRNQLLLLRSDLRFENIRGNIETRMRKVSCDKSPFNATLLAMAGLKRMNYQRKHICVALDPIHECIPAPAQGCIAIDHKAERSDLFIMLRSIADNEAEICAGVERSILQAFDGGCSLPLGCYVKREGLRWHGAAIYCPENKKARRYHGMELSPTRLINAMLAALQ